MKALLCLLALCFAYSSLANDVTYPVKNFKYISDWDFQQEVQDSDKYVVMVFSSKACLERVVIDRTCFLYEKKLDYFIPKFSPSVKVVGFNTYFENYQTVSQFNVRGPTVIILKNNKIIRRIEARVRPADWNQGRMSWQDEFLKETLEVVSRIN